MEPNTPLPPIAARKPPPLPPVAPVYRPPVVWMYRGWCLLFVVIYLAMSAYYILVARGVIEPSEDLFEKAFGRNEEIIAQKRAEAPGLAGFTGAIAAFYVFAAAVPRKPWAWTLGIVALAGTILPFIVTTAGTVPILIHWVKLPVKLYFNRRS